MTRDRTSGIVADNCPNMNSSLLAYNCNDLETQYKLSVDLDILCVCVDKDHAFVHCSITLLFQFYIEIEVLNH